MAAGGRAVWGVPRKGPVWLRVGETGWCSKRGGRVVSEQTSERTSRIAAALQAGASCQEGLSADSPGAFG